MGAFVSSPIVGLVLLGTSLIFVLFAYSVNKHLSIQETEVCTLLKACCCPCFVVGQLAVTVRMRSETGRLVVGPEVQTASVPIQTLQTNPAFPAQVMSSAPQEFSGMPAGQPMMQQQMQPGVAGVPAGQPMMQQMQPGQPQQMQPGQPMMQNPPPGSA